MLKLKLCSYFLTCLVFVAVAAKASTVTPAINSPAIRTAKISGTTIEYIDIGVGAYTLVVESGVGMGLSYWQPLLADFAKLPLRTIIYSRAGNGGSDKANDVSLAVSNKRLALLLQALAAENRRFRGGEGVRVGVGPLARGDPGLRTQVLERLLHQY